MNRLQIITFNDETQSVTYSATKHATHKPI